MVLRVALVLGANTAAPTVRVAMLAALPAGAVLGVGVTAAAVLRGTLHLGMLVVGMAPGVQALVPGVPVEAAAMAAAMAAAAAAGVEVEVEEAAGMEEAVRLGNRRGEGERLPSS